LKIDPSLIKDKANSKAQITDADKNNEEESVSLAK